MKTHSTPAPGKPLSGNQQRRRGVALLTVLTIISLATILILTFFQLAQNEMLSSESYNNGLEAQQIAEEAVNIVVRQIRMATAGEPGQSRGTDIGWASQPGAIRTWDENGNFFKGYKLYSDNEMVIDGNERSLADDDFQELGNWDSKTWQYVDLNEPVIRGEKVYYPIVDPTAREIPEWPKNLGDDTNGIEGFDYTLSGVAEGPMGPAVEGVNSSDGLEYETLPMPVKWIYQLKDGTIGTLDDSRKFVPAAGGADASEENPIVARLAFWADDETCKLNPNVHAGGAAWGTPFAGGDIDRNLGRFQPAQHEWQRYPGHPGSTHIAPVLAPGIPDITYQRDHMERIFELVPRIVGGGSMSGTRKTRTDDPREANGLIADKDRLYPSLDEFLLEPGLKGQNPDVRETNKFPDPNSRRGGARSDEFMQAQLERSKFFLSVVSRAPETTIYNTPRISIWPTRYDQESSFNRSGHHTPFDELIRFCAEVGSSDGSGNNRYRYHFQRSNADSSTHDVDNIERNYTLLQYLDKLTSTPIPGLGGDFDSKYGSDERRQILTMIFDYIRSTNLHDDSLYGDAWRAAFTKVNVADPRTYTNPRKVHNRDRTTHKGHGQVTPIRIDWGGFTAKGMGRFTSLYEVGVHAICCADGGVGEADAYGRWGGPEPGMDRVGVESISYPGIWQYGGGWYVEEDRADTPGGAYPNVHLSNFPPIPAGVNIEPPYYENPSDPTPYAQKRARWDQWPDWLRKMVEPEFIRPPSNAADPSTGTRNPEYDEKFYKPELVPYAFNQRRWNWQLAWLDPQYAGAMPDAKFNRNALSQAAWKSGETRLKTNERLLQAQLILQGFSPSLGWIPINPDMEWDFEMDTLQFAGGGQIPDPLMGGEDIRWSSNGIERASHHDRHYGGTRAWTYFMRATRNDFNSGGDAIFDTGIAPGDRYRGINLRGRPSPIDTPYKSVAPYNRYPFVSRPFKVTNGRLQLQNDSKVNIEIYSAGTDSQTEGTATTVPRQLVQVIDLEIPGFDCPAPYLAVGDRGYFNEFGRIQRGPIAAINAWSLSWDGINPQSARAGRLRFADSHRLSIVHSRDVLKSVGIVHGDARLVAATPTVPEATFAPRNGYDDGSKRFAHTFRTTPGGRLYGDTTPPDQRLVPQVTYTPYPLGTGSLRSADVQKFGDFDNGMGNTMDGPYINKPDEGNIHSLFRRTDPDALALGMFELARDYGDFPYFVRDWIHEAATPSYFSPNRIIASPVQFGSLPVGVFRDADGATNRPWRTLHFRPDVQLPSGTVGSGTNGSVYHPGSITPPDHYLLDLFWMPVVEPYAISEPLSTGGKVNLNYQILPFKHIERSTALRGVFKSEYMLCVPNEWGRDYKRGMGRGRYYHWRDNPFGGTLQQKSLRAVILEDHTLHQFEEKFREGNIFRTASEFCEMHLVPQELAKRIGLGGARSYINTIDFERMSPEQALAQMKDGTYWKEHALVGDNSRERPYSDIYPRITTKSNTFKVHYRAQVLRKAKGSDPGEWDPLYDQVVAEYRGSSIVERYVDPNDPDIPDYAEELASSSGSGITSTTIDEFYKYRVVNPTRFAP